MCFSFTIEEFTTQRLVYYATRRENYTDVLYQKIGYTPVRDELVKSIYAKA
jgi:hypothetical protein